MKRDEGLAAALFALVIGGAVAIAVLSDITAPLCAAAKITTAAPDKIEFGCFEFWLNRYQTLLASFVGVGVAAYVVRPVFQQLKEMGRQTAAAARTAFKERLTSLEVEAGRYTTLANLIRAADADLATPGNPFNPNRAVADRVLQRIEEIEALRMACTVPLLMTSNEVQARAKQEALKHVHAYIRAARQVATSGHFGLSLGPPKLPPLQGSRRPVDVATLCDSVVFSLGDDIAKATVELEDVEAKIRG